MQHSYLVALGSNRPHGTLGRPRDVLLAATQVIGSTLGDVRAIAPVIASAPVGPSLRRYANGALLLDSDRDPVRLLEALKLIERQFGRTCGGQRWASRVLDLDLVLWSGGCWASPGLNVPHLLFRGRDFVLGPAAAIAPDWRDPVSNLTLAQLYARLTRPRPLPRWASHAPPVAARFPFGGP